MFSLMGVELCFCLLLFFWFFTMCIMLIYLCMNNICFLLSWELFSCMSSGVNFDLLFDWMSCSFSGLVCFISGCVMIFSLSYMHGDINSYRFILTVMFFVLSMNFLIFIPSLISLLLGWDGLGLVSFCLVIYYQNNKSLAAGMLTVLMNRVGDCFILGSISVLVILGHWNIMCFWGFTGFEVVNFFIMIAGMTKSAQIPFSSWLPAAMAAPTPVSALVHSSTLVTAGVFLFIRFFNYLSMYYWFNVFMVYISIMTTIMSGVCALYEYDMKKIIALSTLSQLGVMMMSMGLGLPMMALFHLYTHAMFKALLFMCGGNIIHCFNGKQDMRQIGNVSKLLPISCMFLNISNMALCGMPFLAGFYSKDLIIEGLVSGNMNLFMVLMGVLGVCLTVLYSVRFSLFIIWGNESSELYVNIKDEDMKMILPMSLLVLGALWGGLIFQSLFSLFSVNIFLPIGLKLIVPFMIIVSLVMSFSFWEKGQVVNKSNLLDHMNSSMWFISSFICFPTLSGFKGLCNNNLKVVDMGWFEIMGGQGLFDMNRFMFIILEYWLMITFNCYMIIFFIVFMFI
uniref:NADH-ubiquinone oxidoreductase chain 5 n=1 Tax=Heteroteuthis hawaiiensis TaxID=61676 RepID=A0A8F5CDY0_9MOLL|nr:NADH dehydrogenase subunit 5 [Heteroteuthis hawaiiensis]QXJ42098.1 NADH dehydrogenase subunit 5 [Heteroteuthis hawaiiensis]